VVPELVKEGFMLEILYVLGVVKGGGRSCSLSNFLLVFGLSRVDPFKYTEPSEILKRYLKLANSLSSSDIGFGGSSFRYTTIY
jgi:hypothetical protein